ncbi:MAG: hypothetical protein ABI134_11765 [Byssovorax sp.]
MIRRLSTALLGAALLAAAPGCAVYEGAPVVTLEGITNGYLSDTLVPVVLEFSKPVDPATVRVKIVRLVVDKEGNLGDEDDRDDTTLDVLFSTDPEEGDTGGFAFLEEDHLRLKIKPKAAFAAGASLAVLIEKGLSDTAGHVTLTRKRIVFSYDFGVKCDQPSTIFPSGTYFFLAEVKEPIGTQVRLFTAMDVDPATGAFVGRFTNAVRNPDPARCSPACSATDACRLIPAQECVPPSQRAGTTAEFPDYIPNSTPPVGFSFQTTGCVIDQPDGTAAFITAPVDVVVQSPTVTLRNTQITGSFKPGPGGILQGTGSISADDVLLGTTTSGPASGGMSAQSIPEAQVPMGVPQPVPEM